MTDPTNRVVIIGAGHAGGSAAAELRRSGFTGPITLIGEEPLPPYERPPLSKAWLKGETDADKLALKPASFYPGADIDLRLCTSATAIDRAAKTVTLSTGEALPYDTLILATGARARRIPLPGLDLGNVLELRNAADADRLKAVLVPGARLAVVGGGYIGLEAAASARALGAEVTVIDEETEKSATYRIVGADEGDIQSGFLSYTAPLARALLGKTVGQSVEINTPSGVRSYEITKVRYG